MSTNANELYVEMVYAIQQCPSLRTVTDPSSPCQVEIIEARPGLSFSLQSTEYNLVTCIPVNHIRAKALVLHLFANTEIATPMAKIPESMSSLFRVGDTYYWPGAYGPIIMPQLEKCIKLLREYPHTRRAVISMLDDRPHDMNRPACISGLHFLNYRGSLHLIVAQRSLRLDIMPLDCILLTEILEYVCTAVCIPSGELHWHVGNLHAKNLENWDWYDDRWDHNTNLRVNVNNPWRDLCTLLK